MTAEDEIAGYLARAQQFYPELLDRYRAEVLRDQLAYEKRMKQQHEDDLAKLNAIRALHVPYFGFCDECSDGPAYLISYPCPTVLCLKQEESK